MPFMVEVRPVRAPAAAEFDHARGSLVHQMLEDPPRLRLEADQLIQLWDIGGGEGGGAGAEQVPAGNRQVPIADHEAVNIAGHDCLVANARNSECGGESMVGHSGGGLGAGALAGAARL